MRPTKIGPGFGSVAESAKLLVERGGFGATPEEAEQNALANLDAYFAPLIAGPAGHLYLEEGPHHILVTKCTG
ncbi:hypothetical protein [Nocardia seriolae]|uniref:DNA-directed RNA polymerase subunit beta n=1 Tax=Nocardia seriolae TaxID=37332 RepID=A0A0B8N9S8_9NOCA|nr:hypothetical protein [Nocardia seriolae]MTJ62239.1 hypothetical protein [Nocardia seriolae]MTJ74194.1 hypothetical protein [Nocardia seriolae]MTJ87148.1 hypothetical protein [Nocardia seriolae]MTK31142.1 hypothetical protein [Nocardia seriolae]MTK40189.1 hypothetical protein [Nocardia seriolae]